MINVRFLFPRCARALRVNPHALCAWLMLGVMLVADAPAVSAVDTWPGFRGDGSSHTRATNLPATWEMRGRAAGNWSMRLPGYGQSSPVIWKQQIFVSAVSGENKEKLHLIAISLADGSTLWQKELPGTQQVKDSDAVSRGAPTPVVDAERVYFVFESGDIFALSHQGDLQWQRSFVKDYGEIKGPHGFASSPIIVGDSIVLQVAHSGPSYLLALDKKTGENRWKVEHPSQTGWSTPLAVQHQGQSLIIVSTAGSVRAVDASSGELIWTVDNVQGNSTPSPTIAGDRVIIGASSEPGGGGRRSASAAPAAGEASKGAPEAEKPSAPPPQAGSLAIELGGTGNVSESHVTWRSNRVSAGYSSPLVVDGLVYFVNRVGVAQCVDAESGEVLWSERLPAACWTSPVCNEGRIFFFCKEGSVAVYKTGREKETLGESSISTTDVVYGVAAVDNAWIVRTGRGLVRVSSPASETSIDAGR